MNEVELDSALFAIRRYIMIDYALLFVYASFIGVIAVSIGTVLKPLFNRQEEDCPAGC